MLPQEYKDDRLARAQVMVAYTQAGGASDDSTRKEFARLLGINLKAATAEEMERRIPLKPPPGAAGKK